MEITPGPRSGGGKTCDYPASFYAATVEPELPRPALQGEGEVAYAIVGGGYAGLGAALRLAGAGESVALLEACRLGWGASGRNGGQAHIGWNKDQLWLEQTFGLGFARQMWQVAMDARGHLDSLLALDPDRCDFRPGVLHANHRARLDEGTRDHAHYMADFYQHPIRYVPPDELRTMLGAQGYSGGLYDPQGGHLHPLKLALAMARAAEGAGAQLYENSPAVSIRPEGDGWRVETPQGALRARRLLLATGGYGRGLARRVDGHVLPLGNYIAATRPLAEDVARSLIADGIAVSDSRFVVYYYRLSPDNRLIFGGGETYSSRFPADVEGFVRRHLETVFPQLAGVEIDFAWGGTLAVTPDRLPFAREVRPGCFALTGFSGLGVVLAPWLGASVADAMRGSGGLAWDCLQHLPAPRFPGGPWLAGPTQALALGYYALRDRF